MGRRGNKDTSKDAAVLIQAWSPPGVDIKIYFRGGLQNI